MKATVERIEHSDEDREAPRGYHTAFVNLPGHGECITVLGANLTECVLRTAVVIKAFEGA